MSIDNCAFSFHELATKQLPELMKQMEAKLVNPVPLLVFSLKGLGYGPKSIARQLGLNGDFSGCYVLLENNKPFYVGISRKVLSRLRQHVQGSDHNTASLAYSMASAKIKHNLKRSEALKTSEVLDAFNLAQQKLSTAHVAFIQIENDLILYLFEAYCAMQLDTAEWNTFRTH